ncbi:peptidoglycan-binding domain-containing protein [Streptomyces sp. NPDC000594]|uniref:peptidoglycan-binding domain-containing protein n=1 Tax=Streptomyces sp. NPDC000594 TaxID=3154261 RepID=UPI00332FB4EA
MNRLLRNLTILAGCTVLCGAAVAPSVAATAAPPRTAVVAPRAPAPVAVALYCGYDNRQIPPTIRQGSSGDTVREAQCLLEYWGFPVGSAGVDGIFGSATRSATISFQRSRGLVADGIIGPNTWRELRDL